MHSQTPGAPLIEIVMPAPDDFAHWRDVARRLVQSGVAPEYTHWSEPGSDADLFATTSNLPVPPPGALVPRASRRFLQMAQNAALHSHPGRFALLYRLLWRQQRNPQLLDDRADADVRQIELLDRAVRRDKHKMRAFLRFRAVKVSEADAEHFVAWFEPDHHIIRANAAFFTRRFANMHWSILTPEVSIHWDGTVLREGPPAQRIDAPKGDPAEQLWRSYYASIFNPARLKVGAMLKEMPKRYWKNMPEAQLIPQLIAGAQQREAQMVLAGEDIRDAPPQTLAETRLAIEQCRRCSICELGTRAVMGEGPANAPLMIIGEQPGDEEDRTGRPFVGPAGQLLDRFLAQAGIDRQAAYVTAAVKHFKFVQRGKRRLHQTPHAKEIDMCRWWLEAERRIVKPKLVLALGASAARSLLGRTVSIASARGGPKILDDGSELWITTHPSYLLRLGEEARQFQEELFDRDLAAVERRLREVVSMSA